ncbi:sulfatase family protein [Algisphaera agarilytica]|uniref:Arylsulfatase A-like enzyme n=1 Tax=Algisphaera agarilytica TaxID=1385975 RepID=A0A7X0HBH9_9BACT|nr:sulfatase [Algisphaera agarilytica]MBB6431335.1 arylsulfatase A-like enzyme [Algisphaera agarilytica]
MHTAARLLTLALLIATLSACETPQAADKPAAETSKPNIIFILTDDQRWDSVGFMGHPIAQTPNLDRLAAEGHTFNQAFVTSAICTPSRASYMLGQYERMHGINFNSGTSMAPEAWANSYPVLLRNAGYFTGYVGKNHLPIGEKGYYTGLMEKSFDYWYAGHHHIGFYPKDRHEIFDNAELDTQAEVVSEGIQAFLDPESNEAFMNNAIRFLEKRPDGQPFMLSVCLNLPHGFSTQSMEQRPTDDELYRTAYREWQSNLPLPDSYIAREDIQSPKLPADVLLADLRQTGYDWVDQPDTARERMIRVLQAVTGIDRMVGELREKLEELGIADNTILIFTSDHGLFNGEHGLGGKSLCYETNLRVPMVIYDPRVTQGRRSDDLALSIDIAPTILSMAGVSAPDSMQGMDLSPITRGQDVPWRDAAFGENLWSTIFGNPRCETVRTQEYRYIRYFANDNRELRERTPNNMLYTVTPEIAGRYEGWLTASIKGDPVVYEELFHIASDPYEVNNLANDPEYAEVLEDLRARCIELVAEAKGDVDTPPLTIPVTKNETKTNYRNNQ